MAPMTDFERERIREWMLARRGEQSQQRLAEDIEATTGYRITRDRYSKYESGATPFGRSVFAELLRYWQAKGEPGPDFTRPEPTPDLATALLALAAELAALREERTGLVARVTDLEAMVAKLAAPSVEGSGAGAGPRAPLVPMA